MEKRVCIYTIPNNLPGTRPRLPMVQIITAGAYESASFTFHPRHAAKISRAINAAARAAKAGRKLATVEVDTTNEA